MKLLILKKQTQKSWLAPKTQASFFHILPLLPWRTAPMMNQIFPKT
jgi:hypothetical protein